ncbi:beta-propeller domain-containing protein [Sunxiuqinia sp. sy24]|uniref:beta-propeller domain-containing protein n=1 Tax=Sunxiuqinia sp. sy24 TaxID=3461495 RepID=UPI0040467650
MKQIKSFLTLTIILLSLHATGQEVQHRFIASGSGMKNIVIANEQGDIEWSYPAGKECNDVSLLSDSTILFSCSTGAKLVSLQKEVLWEYKGAPNTEVQSASMLRNGNILIIQNGTPALLKEINRKGKIKRELIIPTSMKNPHAQFRNIRQTPDKTYLVGYFRENKVCEFDRKGNIIRTIPIKGNAFASIRLSNGNTLIACGDGHRLIEIDKEGNEVWTVEENEIPDHPLRFVANVQRLPNGNTVICNWGGHGHKNGQAQVFEITRDKKVVWEVNDWARLGMISTLQILDVEGKMEHGDLFR